MTSERLCPEHHLVLDTNFLLCPMGHEVVITERGWWEVVDVEKDPQDPCYLIAIVLDDRRIRWSEWYEDIFAYVSGRNELGMTAAAAKRTNYSALTALQKRDRRNEERRSARRAGRVPAEWATIRRRSA